LGKGVDEMSEIAKLVLALAEDRDKYKEQLEVDEQLLRARDSVLNAIPECPAHGPQCVPHALEWVANVQTERDKYKALAGELAEALRDMVELRELTMQSRVNPEKPEMVVASRAKAVVAKYDCSMKEQQEVRA